MVSKYCQECLKFIQGDCKGKPKPKHPLTYWGQVIKNTANSGLNFCEQFEFDGRLYTYPKNCDEKIETFKEIRKRQVKKQRVTEDQEHFDDFELSLNLSSSDLEKLI